MTIAMLRMMTIFINLTILMEIEIEPRWMAWPHGTEYKLSVFVTDEHGDYDITKGNFSIHKYLRIIKASFHRNYHLCQDWTRARNWRSSMESASENYGITFVQQKSLKHYKNFKCCIVSFLIVSSDKSSLRDVVLLEGNYTGKWTLRLAHKRLTMSLYFNSELRYMTQVLK